MSQETEIFEAKCADAGALSPDALEVCPIEAGGLRVTATEEYEGRAIVQLSLEDEKRLLRFLWEREAGREEGRNP